MVEDETELKGQKSPGGQVNNNESGRVVNKKPFLQRGAGKAGGVGKNANKTPSRSNLKKDALEGSGYKNGVNQDYTYDQGADVLTN